MKKLSFLRLKLQQETKALEDGLASNDLNSSLMSGQLGGGQAYLPAMVSQPRSVPSLTRIVVGDPKSSSIPLQSQSASIQGNSAAAGAGALSLLDIQKTKLRGKYAKSTITSSTTTPHLHVTLSALQKEYLAYEAERVLQRDSYSEQKQQLQQKSIIELQGSNNELENQVEQESTQKQQKNKQKKKQDGQQEEEAEEENSDGDCSLDRIEAEFRQQQRQQLLQPIRKKKSEFLMLLREGNICSNSDLTYATKPFKYVKKLKDVRIMLERKSNNLNQQLKRSNMNKNQIIEDIKADRVHIRNALPDMAKKYLSSISARNPEQLSQSQQQQQHSQKQQQYQQVNNSFTPISQTLRVLYSTTQNESNASEIASQSLKLSSPKSVTTRQLTMSEAMTAAAADLGEKTGGVGVNNNRAFISYPSRNSPLTPQSLLQKSRRFEKKETNESMNSFLDKSIEKRTQNNRKINSMSNASFSTLTSMSQHPTPKMPTSSSALNLAASMATFAKKFNQQQPKFKEDILDTRAAAAAAAPLSIPKNFSNSKNSGISVLSESISQPVQSQLSPEKQLYRAYLEREGLLASQQNKGESMLMNESPTNMYWRQSQSGLRNKSNSLSPQKSRMSVANIASGKGQQQSKEGILANVYNFENDQYFKHQSIYKFEQEKASITMIRRNKPQPRKNAQHSTQQENLARLGRGSVESISPKSLMPRIPEEYTTSLDASRAVPAGDISHIPQFQPYATQSNVQFSQSQSQQQQQQSSKQAQTNWQVSRATKKNGQLAIDYQHVRGKQQPSQAATAQKKMQQKRQKELDDYFHDEFSSNDDSIPSATEIQLENYYEESIKLQNKIKQADKGDLQSKIKNLLRIETVNNEIQNLVHYKTKK